MAQLLVVHHSPRRSLQALTDAVVSGAHDPAITGVQVLVRPALEATAGEVLSSEGYILGTAAHFGYMSGALKHFFDTTFLRVGGQLSPDGEPGVTAKRPFGLYVHGRYDTEGAIRSVLSITGALGWRPSAAPLAVLGDVEREQTDAAYELGATVAAVLM